MRREPRRRKMMDECNKVAILDFLKKTVLASKPDHNIYILIYNI